jgi:5-(carboxyamino)imidazole ribonucleotide synthase
MSAPLPPGSTVGIVGGGQLGRMLTVCAHQLGYRVAVLTGGAKDTPAGRVAEIEIATGFDDETGIERFVAESDVITWEFENVDLALVDVADRAGVEVRPAGDIVAVAQDREREKLALVEAGVRVAEWRPARTIAEMRTAVEALRVPVIAKAARFGYDGKGQVRIDHPDQVTAAWEQLGGARLVVEAVIPFLRELSVIVARDENGVTVDHGVMENHHEHHILDTTMVPAEIPGERQAEATALARHIADAWRLVGVLAVEIFDTGTDLIVNEVAPRPHNSGHCSIEAAPASQFEQQLRAVCGLPLGDGACRPAAMVQLLGDLWADGEPDWSAALADPAVHLHLYGKADARPRRKMGHLTCVGDDPTQALQRAVDARVALSGR